MTKRINSSAKNGLSPRVKEIVQFYFDNPGQTQLQLAAHFGISAPRVSAILTSRKVVETFPILARRKISSMVPKAVRRLGELMQQNDNLVVAEKVTASVLHSHKILDMPVQKVEHSLSNATIEDLQRIVGQAAGITGPIMDAELVIDAPEELPGSNLEC